MVREAVVVCILRLIGKSSTVELPMKDTIDNLRINGEAKWRSFGRLPYRTSAFLASKEWTPSL